MNLPIVRLVCFWGERPCQDDRCPRCRGYGAFPVRGWRRRLIAWIGGLR